MNRLLIKGGRVVDPGSGIDGLFDVLVVEGKISEVTKPGHKEKIDTGHGKIINAAGLVVCPGFIDMHTHLREPGYEYKETIKTGTMAGAAGGFTTIVCMANTNPVNDSASVTKYILKKAQEEGVINVYPVGAASKGLRGEALAEIGDMKGAGCVAISDDGRPIMNSNLMRLALEYAKLFDLLLISHCEDLALSQEGSMNEGFISTRLGLKGIPNAAEESMVARDISLAELTGGRVHIAHISTRGSVELVRRAKEKGIRVSAEVTPHHFALTDEAVIGYTTNAKMNPPLRSAKDVEALKRGLKDGTIDAIATDHAPQDSVEKDVEFDRASNGVVGLETAFSLSLRLVSEGVLTLSELIQKMSCGPSKILGLERKGSLKAGADADITLIDLDKEWVVDINQLQSKSKNTPFHGWTMKGRVVKTIVEGNAVWSEPTASR